MAAIISDLDTAVNELTADAYASPRSRHDVGVSFAAIKLKFY